MRNLTRVLVLLLLLLAAPSALRAQEESGHVSLVAGVANWDLAGTGQDVVYGLRVGSPINSNIGWELNASYFHAEDEDAPGATHVFIPELQFQLAHAFSGFTPFVGLGAGASIQKREDEEVLPGFDQEFDAVIDFAPSASLGARIRIVDGLALQAEGRLHGIEADFTGTVVEITGGVVISF
jgi:hypothetical protein